MPALSKRPLVLAIGICVAGLTLLAPTAVAEPVGTQQQLTTFSPATTATTSGGPSVAYSASSRKTLVAYIENVAVSASAPDGGMLRAAFLNGDAALASTPVDLSTTLPVKAFAGGNAGDPPAVAAGPDGTWLVVWSSPGTGSTVSVNAQVVGADGNPVGANLVLSSKANYGDIQTVSLAWSQADARYLVTWMATVSAAFPTAASTKQLVGRFVDASGVGIGDDFLVTNTADGANGSQDVAYGNGRWIAVAATNLNRRAVGQVVTAAGPQGAPFNLSTAGYNAGNNNIGPSIAYNAATSQFGVVFKLRNSPYTEYARLLDGTGAPLGSNIDLGGGGNRPRITSAGQYGYLTSWHGPGGSNVGPVYAMPLAADGTVEGAPRVLSDASPFEGWRPSAVYDASLGKYLITYAGYSGLAFPNGATNVYARPWFVNTPPVGLTVAKDGAGTGTVTSSPTGIDCGATCTFAFDSAATVTLTATSAPGSAFAGWGGACSGTATTCTVTMSAAASVAASFAVEQLAATAAAAGAEISQSAPAPSAKVRILSAERTGSALGVRTRISGPGRVRVVGTVSTRGTRAARTIVCTGSRRATRAGVISLVCAFTTAGRALLVERPLAVRLAVSLTLANGATARSVLPVVRVPKLVPAVTPVTG